MTFITLKPTMEDQRIAKLAAIAIALHVIEAAFPSPLPGVKPGVANVITLFLLYRYDFSTAAWVTLLRVFASSLLMGQFLTPGFLLSLGGAISSLVLLSLATHLPRRYFSAISLSILAAFAHIAAQLAIVAFLLMPHATMTALIPVFASSALFFGFINGMITTQLLNMNKKGADPSAPQ